MTNGIRAKVTALRTIWAQHEVRKQEDVKPNQSNEFVFGCMAMMDEEISYLSRKTKIERSK